MKLLIPLQKLIVMTSSDVPMLSSTRSEILLDRLRSKSATGAMKPLQDLSRLTRQTLMDRRFGLDSKEKSVLQKSLDLMQVSDVGFSIRLNGDALGGQF